jgi:hypothetical protein
VRHDPWGAHDILHPLVIGAGPEAEDGPVRDLPDPGFAGDQGAAPPEVVAALRAYDAAPAGRHDATLEVLQRARLLVPVVALPGEVEYDARGLAQEKTSDMATVLTRGEDGRTALLAFTSTDSLGRWDRDARPVPVTTSRAAEAALAEGAVAVVVDVAGPVMFVIGVEDLRELAAGSLLVRVGGTAGVSDRYGWATPGR